MMRIFRHKGYFIGVHIVMCISLLATLYAYSPAIRVKVKEIIEPADKVYTIAHRGASGYAPENTMPAFELAAQMKADSIELDVHLTKDQIPVVIHDETVNRTTDGKGYVKNMTLEQLRQLDAGSWFNQAYPMFARDLYTGLTIPTLDEVFDKFGSDINYMIEIKEPVTDFNIEAILNETIKTHRLEKVVAIHSFSAASLKGSIPLTRIFRYISWSGTIMPRLESPSLTWITSKRMPPESARTSRASAHRMWLRSSGRG